MRKKLKTLPVIIALFAMISSYALASDSACGDNAYYLPDASHPFWGKSQTGGCDYIDENGCLVHVEIYTKYRLWINFGTEERIETFC